MLVLSTTGVCDTDVTKCDSWMCFVVRVVSAVAMGLTCTPAPYQVFFLHLICMVLDFDISKLTPQSIF